MLTWGTILLWVMTPLLWALRRERFTITRQWTGEEYLTRWTLLGRRFEGSQRLFLHCFHRSDYDTPHDHPWPFWSLVLWGGYWEHTFTGYVDPATGERQTARRWYGPLSLLRRPAEWAHRVEVPHGKRVWSLVWAGAKVRGWGFHCKGGWIPWRQHQQNMMAGGSGCG